MGGRTFQERAELVLIACLALGFLLIAQRASHVLFQVGLGLVIVATFLEIAVGNVPLEASARRAMLMIGLILAVVAAVFGLGILLVPYLTRLGR